MRRAIEIKLDDKEREELKTLKRSRTASVRLAERVSIVLLADEGKENREIANLLRMTRQKAGRWRDRFAKHGLAGIEKDAHRSGRLPQISQ